MRVLGTQVETTHLTALERDTSKDQFYLSKNFSAFNFNRDFLRTLGRAIGEHVAHLEYGQDLGRQKTMPGSKWHVLLVSAAGCTCSQQIINPLGSYSSSQELIPHCVHRSVPVPYTLKMPCCQLQ